MDAWQTLLRTHAHVIAVLERELVDEADLPLSWYDVLLNLHEAPQRRLRMQELADAVVLSRSGLTRLVDRMAVAGLVQRRHSDDDRRVIYAILTDGGERRLREAAPVHVRGIEAHFGQYLTESEANELVGTLSRVMRGE